MSSGSFKMLSTKYVYTPYVSNILYEQNSALNNLQWLICYKTQPNQNQRIIIIIFTLRVFTTTTTTTWLGFCG